MDEDRLEKLLVNSHRDQLVARGRELIFDLVGLFATIVVFGGLSLVAHLIAKFVLGE